MIISITEYRAIKIRGYVITSIVERDTFADWKCLTDDICIWCLRICNIFSWYRRKERMGILNINRAQVILYPEKGEGEGETVIKWVMLVFGTPHKTIICFVCFALSKLSPILIPEQEAQASRELLPLTVQLTFLFSLILFFLIEDSWIRNNWDCLKGKSSTLSYMI